MLNRKELRKKLPKGYCKVIAMKAGVTQRSVSLYFDYKFNSERIEDTLLIVLSELNTNKKKLLEAI